MSPSKSSQRNAKLSPEAVQTLETQVLELLERELDATFYPLAVDFEKDMGHWCLRIYLERSERAGNPGVPVKVTLQDCESVSRQIGDAVETLKALEPLTFNLEVSSPGLNRILKTSRELAFYKNYPVQVAEVVDAERTVVYEGLLSQVSADTLEIHPNLADASDPPYRLPIVALEENTALEIALNPHIDLDSDDSASDTPA